MTTYSSVEKAILIFNYQRLEYRTCAALLLARGFHRSTVAVGLAY